MKAARPMRTSVAAPLDEPPAAQPPIASLEPPLDGSGFGFEPEPPPEPPPPPVPPPEPEPGSGLGAAPGADAIGRTDRYADSLICGCMMSDVSLPVVEKIAR